MWARRPGFRALMRIILEQQVSLASADALVRRLESRIGPLTPAAVRGCGLRGLRRLGLTRQKATYCHGLAERVLDGDLDLRAVASAADDEGRRTLLAVPGLGPWSVDIYYLMALRRPDVWPRGDLALARALARVKRLDGTPDPERQHDLARVWAPWRSVAARMLWQYYLALDPAERRAPPA
jgi:DNA-3-methyladenine glycosylase II